MTNAQMFDHDAPGAATFLFATAGLARLNCPRGIVVQSVWGTLPRREAAASWGSGRLESHAELAARFERGSQSLCALLV